MWSKWVLLAALFASFPVQAEEDWHPETVTFEVKEKTRFYRWSTYDKKTSKQIFVSFVLPKGVILEGCGSINDGFLEGKDCGQAEEPTVVGIIEKDGKKRRIEISLGGGAIDFKRYPNMKTLEGRRENNKQLAMSLPHASLKVLSHGDFLVAGEEVGYFSIKSLDKNNGKFSYLKDVFRGDGDCSLNGGYIEKVASSDESVTPQDWLFEGMFDEIMRSMRCEEVSRDYVEKWGKEWEAKEAAKQAPAKAAPPKKSAKK